MSRWCSVQTSFFIKKWIQLIYIGYSPSFLGLFIFFNGFSFFEFLHLSDNFHFKKFSEAPFYYSNLIFFVIRTPASIWFQIWTCFTIVFRFFTFFNLTFHRYNFWRSYIRNERHLLSLSLISIIGICPWTQFIIWLIWNVEFCGVVSRRLIILQIWWIQTRLISCFIAVFMSQLNFYIVLCILRFFIVQIFFIFIWINIFEIQTLIFQEFVCISNVFYFIFSLGVIIQIFSDGIFLIF